MSLRLQLLRLVRSLALLGMLAWRSLLPAAQAAAAGSAVPEARALLAKAVASGDASAQIEAAKQLVGVVDPLVARALTAWRVSELFLMKGPGDIDVPVLLDEQQDSEGKARAIRLLDGEFAKDADGKELRFAAADLTPADTTSKVRKAIKTTLDLLTLGSPTPKIRRDAVIKLGQEQNPEYLVHFRTQLEKELNGDVRRALDEAIALTQMADAKADVRIPAIEKLGTLRSINSISFLQAALKDATGPKSTADAATTQALKRSIREIEDYLWRGNLIGTAFRGLSLAAVLLVAALGLAITFGLMGVINMAHGEVMMVGAYTAYVCQNIFITFFGAAGFGFDCYFLAALVAAFLVAGAVGWVLERGIIRFLYKRPLESLLATWGVSLVLQQVFRHIFGAANVQVTSPSWLSGSLVIEDVLFAYNRMFVIAFALGVVLLTYSLLTRTSLGLQIRAVMQNRAMASCVGVRTDRVNMMTFAFGSGLAGMAGACLSQIGNVGPGLGQNYVVDCFMVVVLGGVGNLVGTVSASLGVGVTDQILQPWLGAVLGKITVLAAIILFLQWRPAGLFATRSRSLD